MFKPHLKLLIGFVVLMTALSTVVVRYGVDAQFRGYPLPFVAIESGVRNEISVGWRVPNLLLSLALCLSVAIGAVAASRLSVATRNWFFLGLGLLLGIVITACSLGYSVSEPIANADALQRAIRLSTVMRHCLAIGTLASAACFFVCLLKLFPATQPAKKKAEGLHLDT